MPPQRLRLIQVGLLAAALSACGQAAPPASTGAQAPPVASAPPTQEQAMTSDPATPTGSPSDTPAQPAETPTPIPTPTAPPSPSPRPTEAQPTAQPSPPPRPSATLQAATAAPPTAAPAAAPDPRLAPLVDRARGDLAARLGLDAGAIELLDARAVVWPDRSAGCPQPGVAYQQVLTEGAFISLRAAGAVYNYHSREGRDPAYCPTSAGPPPSGGAPAGPGSGAEP